MKTAELSKIEGGKVDESNAGHIKDKGGKQEDKSRNDSIIEAYDVSWNVNKRKQ